MFAKADFDIRDFAKLIVYSDYNGEKVKIIIFN